ncbi:MAG TPA: EAL domain-containing protein [Dyella sp.]|nr:EAL domain-containing protein [Dyella sp.]
MTARFALDDFGSGMSSLSYLKQLPVDYLKLDGAFVRQITTSPADAAIVEAMARVASVMGIRTVAEYVDTEATRTLLEQLNIDYVQGFCVHVPEPFADLLKLQRELQCQRDAC